MAYVYTEYGIRRGVKNVLLTFFGRTTLKVLLTETGFTGRPFLQFADDRSGLPIEFRSLNVTTDYGSVVFKLTRSEIEYVLRVEINANYDIPVCESDFRFAFEDYDRVVRPLFDLSFTLPQRAIQPQSFADDVRVK